MSLSHFHNAHHFEANNGQFINAASGANLTINNNADAVSTILRQYVATGATFDSAERFPPGKCHPGTRKRITEEIMNWIDDAAATQYILWLYGPAGSGKSALAQSICEILAKSRRGRKAASFFFANGQTDRGNALKLLPTISYQLCIQFPSVREEINKALDRDPTLPTKSMEIQLLSLIVEPLLQSKHFPLHHPVVIIDGLDECADDDEANTQREIVALIAKSIIDYKLPLRFFVASRPEYWIRDAFSTSPLPTITLSLSLLNELDANRDIRTYLTDEFEKIRVKNARVMGSVTLPWPPEQVIEHFVYEASGQFIYASTVIRFVGKSSRFGNPLEQLRIITSPGPQRAVAFSELDRLYSKIIAAYPRWETMKRVLGGLLVYGSPTIVKIFLDVMPDELVLVMDALSPLIDITDARTTDEMLRSLSNFTLSTLTRQDAVSFCHLSFVEFLKDEARSGQLYVDVDHFRNEISRVFFGMIHHSLDQNYGTDRNLIWNVDFATYRWIMYRVAMCQGDSRMDRLHPLITHLNGRLETLLELDFATSMESPGLVLFAEDMMFLECSIIANILEFSTQTQRGKDKKQFPGFQTSCEKLRDTIFLARERAMNELTLCIKPKITPVLVYLAEFHRGTDSISPKTLSRITGSADVIYTIEQNRHIVHLSYSHSTHLSLTPWSPPQWCLLQLVDLKLLLAKVHATCLRIQDSDEWKNQRIFLLRHMLKLTLSEHWWSYIHLDCWFDYCFMVKECLFDSRSIVDICGNTLGSTAKCQCLSFLTLIGNLHCSEETLQSWPWDIVRRRVPGFIDSMIFWLNRQLRNPQHLKLFQDHDVDKALPQKLTTMMNHLFQNFFLSQFLASYTKKIYATRVFPGGEYPRDSLKVRVLSFRTMEVLPLPQGFYANCGAELFNENLHPKDVVWSTFHEEVFGNKVGSLASSPIIDPSSWHPHLASRLLNDMVKFLYGHVHPGFSVSNSGDDADEKEKLKKSLSYLTQCLPFAEPNSDNLDALRLIVYLYPLVDDISTVMPLLPEGLWVLIAALLRKYPRFLLSSEELCLFERWLSSSDHSDIRKYVATSLNDSNSDHEPDRIPLAGMSAENYLGEHHRALIPGQKRYSVLAPQDERRKRAKRDDKFT